MSKMPNDEGKQARSGLLKGRRTRRVAAISIALVFAFTAFGAAATMRPDSNWTASNSAHPALGDSNWT